MAVLEELYRMRRLQRRGQSRCLPASFAADHRVMVGKLSRKEHSSTPSHLREQEPHPTYYYYVHTTYYYLLYTASPHARTKLHNLRAQRAQAAPPFVRFDSRTLWLVWIIVSLAPSQRFLLPSKTRWICGLQMPPVKRLLYFGSLSRNPQPFGP